MFGFFKLLYFLGCIATQFLIFICDRLHRRINRPAKILSFRAIDQIFMRGQFPANKAPKSAW